MMIVYPVPEKLDQLPQTPGVYLFLDARGVILYVGKATILRSRVRQYFSGQEEKSRGRRMRRLVQEVVAVRVHTTETALEALFLEAALIKKHQPRYNVTQKDDSSFVVVVITRERIPRVLVMRQTDVVARGFMDANIAQGNIFGPYASKRHVMAALKILRKIFPYHDRAGSTEKGCLAYQIGLCPGPYDNAITVDAYRSNIRALAAVLRGQRTRVVRDIERRMHRAAAAENFEEAMRVRKQWRAMQHLQDAALLGRSFDDHGPQEREEDRVRIECYDMSHLGTDDPVGAMVVSYNGVMDPKSYRIFRIKHAAPDNDLAMMREVLGRRLLHTTWPRPHVIVLDGGSTHVAMAEELWRTLGVDIPVMAVSKGPTRKKVDVHMSQHYPVMDAIVPQQILLETLREEAHRKAIGYHRLRRAKRRHLDEIAIP